MSLPPRDLNSDFERERVRRELRAQLFQMEDPLARIGRFEVLGRIGTGAASVVYLGRDPDLDRRVAIKVMLQGREISSAMRGRLAREGRALAKLAHPNVVRIFEIGTHGDDVFLAVEFVDGDDLAAWFNEAQHPWPAVVEVMQEAGAGLAAAHELDLVHRDVKPANILIDTDKRVRVADFGLVQPAGAAESSPQLGGIAAPSIAAPSVTRTGMRVGSPAYMAPEQWSGDTVDARTDQFGFCVTFYEALHGHRPFQGETEAELAEAICEARFSTKGANDTPSWLDDVVRRGLSPSPADRYPSMHDLLSDLRSRHQSHTLVEAANKEVEELDHAVDAAHFARHAATARTRFAQALDVWPEHPTAASERAKLLQRWLEHDLAQRTPDAAAARLSELGHVSPELTDRVKRVQQDAAETAASLAKLAAIEHDESPFGSLRLKLRMLVVQAPVWTALAVAAGEAHRRQWFEVGTKQLFIALTVLASISLAASTFLADKVPLNRNSRMVVGLGTVNTWGAALMLGFAWWLAVPTWQALLFIQLMRTTFWFGGGVYIDRRLFLVAFVALAGAVAMRWLPDYAIDLFGLATGGALLLVAWRTAVDAPEQEAGSRRA